jgi:hypothetical protein
LKRTIGLGGALALGVTTVLLATPALAADTQVLHMGDIDFSDTQTGGHYEVEGTGLHVWTVSAKVAGYVATSARLSGVGEPSLDYTATSGTTPPGFQMVVDFDGDSTADGILVGEPTFYGNDWWASNGSKQFVKDSVPSHDGGYGSQNHGTLEQWRAKFRKARVAAFGFSLGSGVQGDGVIDSLEFAGTSYTFAKGVTVTSKDECRNGGWATSTDPTYKNQGECVSSFAKLSPKKLAKQK